MQSKADVFRLEDGSLRLRCANDLMSVLKSEKESYRTIYFRFSLFIMSPAFCDHSDIYCDYEWTPEMLWTCFYMAEMYGKYWNGEAGGDGNWVKPLNYKNLPCNELTKEAMRCH
jgi:hypothetical protein